MESYNVYFNPEKFGLTTIYEHNFGMPSYAFDIRVVWEHSDGTRYTARDSGRSWPPPFEDYKGLQDLEKIPQGMADFRLLDPEEWKDL